MKAPSPSSHISIASVLTKKSAGQNPAPFREKAGRPELGKHLHVTRGKKQFEGP